MVGKVRLRRNLSFLLFLLSFAAASSSACRERGDPVRGTLDAAVAAAEKRDTEAVSEHLASNFRAADGSGLADAQATLRRYLAAYEGLDIRLSNVTIERSEGAARVTFRADLEGSPRQIGGLESYLPRSSSYRFDLRLVPEGGRWKIVWASWEPAQDR